jgi:hypothetical protein
LIKTQLLGTLKMGEKLYRVHLKSGQHLVSSKDNPGRVRGTSRDANNQNPDIPEFEEVTEDEYAQPSPDPYEDSRQEAYQREESALTPAEEELARILAEVLVKALIEGTGELLQTKVLPWWANTAWPALKQQSSQLKVKLSSGINQLKVSKMLSKKAARLKDSSLPAVNTGSKLKASQPLKEDSYIRIMLMAAQARKVGFEKIQQENLSEADKATRLSQFDALLSKQASMELDQILSSPQLRLPERTASTILSATGGGIKVDDVYQPVHEEKVRSAFVRYSKLPNDQLDYIRSLHTNALEMSSDQENET